LRRAVRQRLTVLGLTAPAYVWLALTIFLPLSAMFYFSFLTFVPWGTREASVTLDHYAAFFEKSVYRINAWRSLKLGLHVTLGCLVVGYPAALILAKHVRGRWREALFLLIVLPFWSNGLVRTFSWTMVLRGDSLIDRGLHALLPGAPSLDLLFTYPAIVIGLVHAYVPYMILTCYISLQAIDDSLIEAGRSLGASPLTAFRRITLPLSLPGVLAGVVLIFVPAIGSFMEPRILGGTNAIMLGTIIEDQFMALNNWPFGAALSFIMLGIVLILMAASYPLLRRHGQSF
jgi:spermidine/putrescine transport system permease protein